MKIIVLGAGIIGITTAYFLSRSGHEVLVIDKAESAGLGASFANGGLLSYSYSAVLATPTLLPKLPKMLLGKEPAFEIKLSTDPALFSWGLRFLRNCTGARATFNSDNVERLAWYSREQLHQLLAQLPIHFDYQRRGKLYLYTNQQDFLTATKDAELKNQKHPHHQQQVLTQMECLAKEPALQHLVKQIVGGIFSPREESGDAFQFIQALVNICTTSYPVQFVYNTEIKSFTMEKGRISQVKTADNSYSADAVVMCLGADSPLLGKTLNIKLPIYPQKGYSLTLPIIPAALTLNIVDTHHKIVYTTLGDKLRIAGTLEMCGYDTSINEQKWQRILKIAQHSFPEAGDYQQVTPWVGLRPSTPDAAPILGKTRYPNFYLNTGHGMLGWTLACGSAAIITDIINDTAPAIDLNGLTFERF